MVELKKKGNKGDFGDFETRKNIVPRLKPNNLCIKQLYNLKVISGVQKSPCTAADPGDFNVKSALQLKNY